jgi:hypothetical protein
MNTITRLFSLTMISLPLFLLCGATASAQYAEGLETDQPLFATHDMLTARIQAPLSTLMKKRSDEEYLDGMFYLVDANGEEQALELKIRTRGKFRLQKSTCKFPPIRLNFKTGQLTDTELAGQDKLKLVSHCQNRTSYEQLILREYLAYRMYQALTDKSFGARLMRIAYDNSEDNKDPLVRYGFVIEDEDKMGARLGQSRGMMRKITVPELDPQQANLVAVYLYMIGNTDYSLILGPPDDECCHNAMLYSDGSPPYTPIPYDFDFSGIVNAPYAEPSPQLKIRNVKTRLYRGRCVNNGLLDGTLAYFIEKEAEIYGLIDGLEGLDDKNTKDVKKYMDGFYKDIKDPKTVQKKFVDKCL